MYNGPPASPAAPACLSPFIFLHKANSHPLINAAASLGTFSSLYLFFCPEMPEASSCSAQNSADLSAALSPGSSYLISFCTSLAPWLSAFLLSRFLSQAHCVADCVFPSENLVSTFFLIWTPSHCLFLPPPPSIPWWVKWGQGWEMGKAIAWWFLFCGGAHWRSGKQCYPSSFCPLPPRTKCPQLPFQTSHRVREVIPCTGDFVWLVSFSFVLFMFCFYFALCKFNLSNIYHKITCKPELILW